MLGGKYLWQADSELYMINQAVKLAGTNDLTVGTIILNGLLWGIANLKSTYI